MTEKKFDTDIYFKYKFYRYSDCKIIIVHMQVKYKNSNSLNCFSLHLIGTINYFYSNTHLILLTT